MLMNYFLSDLNRANFRVEIYLSKSLVGVVCMDLVWHHREGAYMKQGRVARGLHEAVCNFI